MAETNRFEEEPTDGPDEETEEELNLKEPILSEPDNEELELVQEPEEKEPTQEKPEEEFDYEERKKEIEDRYNGRIDKLDRVIEEIFSKGSKYQESLESAVGKKEGEPKTREEELALKIHQKNLEIERERGEAIRELEKQARELKRRKEQEKLEPFGKEIDKI